ncbi:MAG: erg26, C-3 sterol dehydrogenase [Trizodia sp. TS-e1964]|nr:MAG: erg26, C-3 sterol dehydrogenase [Trizodia sp. TS-e1964]
MLPDIAKEPLGSVLVVGGCGFLGHHIVEQLHKSSGCLVSVIDLQTTRNRFPNVNYYNADITVSSSVCSVFEKVRPDVIIHTASPVLMQSNEELMYRVNVVGTKVLVEEAAKIGAKAFIYTSSASVISDNATDLVNADERWPYVESEQQTEYYSQTKADAEAFVLAANRNHGDMLTASLRPAGIIGEGDVQSIPNMIAVLRRGQTGFQLGDNSNLFDFTYVGNVAYAHILAARALLVTHQKYPTSLPPASDKVDGEAFFITNGSPIYFWDMPRSVWKVAGHQAAQPKVINRGVGLALANVMEWVFWCAGKVPSLSKKQVRYSCMTRYYSINKAIKILGYGPPFTLEEGIERAVKWYLEQEAAKTMGATVLKSL